MRSRLTVLGSSVGTKLLIGVTGLALFVYLIIHIVGNLMIFGGYGAVTQSQPSAARRFTTSLCGDGPRLLRRCS